MILEFQEFETTEKFLQKIDSALLDHWQKKSYTISGKDGRFGIVGKNVITGRDDPSAARTISWGEIHKSPEGTYYIFSPFGNRRFCIALPDLKEGSYVERAFPQEWDEALEKSNAGFVATIRIFSKRLLGVFRGWKV